MWVNLRVSPGDPKIGGADRINRITAGRVATETFDVRLPSQPLSGFPANGVITFGMLVDADGEVTESSETNNYNRGTGRDERQITVSLDQLAAPTLQDPDDNETLVPTRPDFNWTNVTGADRYRIIVATSRSALPTGGEEYDPNDSRIVIDELRIGSTNSAYSHSSGTALNDGQTYYWTVRAGNNSTGAGGLWASSDSFTTIPNDIGAPDLSTVTATSETSILTKWSEVDGATGYRLFRSTSSVGPWDSSTEVYSGTATEFIDADSNLSLDTSYYYRVQAFNEIDDSDLSQIRSIYFEDRFDPTVSLDSPRSGTFAIGDQIQIEMSASDPSEINRVRAVVFKGGTSAQHRLGKIFSNGSGQGVPSAISWVVPAKINGVSTVGDDVRIAVGAWDNSGNFNYGQDFSESLTINDGSVDQPDAPTNVTATPVGYHSILIEWDPAIEIGNYYLERRTDGESSFKQIRILDASETSRLDNGTHLEHGKSYSYRVRAVTANVFSDWSEVTDGTAITPPTPAAPGQVEVEVTDNTATLTWDFVDSTNEYVVQRSVDGGRTWFDTILGIETASAAGTLEHVEEDLPESTSVLWRIWSSFWGVESDSYTEVGTQSGSDSSSNDAPTSSGQSDVILVVNSSQLIDLDSVFTDDHDAQLGYTVSLSPLPSTVEALLTGNRLRLTGHAVGTVNVSVKATDTEGLSTTTSFDVLVEEPNSNVIDFENEIRQEYSLSEHYFDRGIELLNQLTQNLVYQDADDAGKLFALETFRESPNEATFWWIIGTFRKQQGDTPANYERLISPASGSVKVTATPNNQSELLTLTIMDGSLKLGGQAVGEIETNGKFILFSDSNLERSVYDNIDFEATFEIIGDGGAQTVLQFLRFTDYTQRNDPDLFYEYTAPGFRTKAIELLLNARREGMGPRLTDTYRSPKEQLGLFNDPNVYAARPWVSNHQYGIAVDINVSGGSPIDYNRLGYLGR